MYLSSSRARWAEVSQGKVPVSSRNTLPIDACRTVVSISALTLRLLTTTTTRRRTTTTLTLAGVTAKRMKQPLRCGEQPCAAKNPKYDEQFWHAWNVHQSLWSNCGMQNAHRNTATHRSKKHETLFIVHGRSEHDIAWFEHDPSMKPLQSKNYAPACTGHEKCDSKFWWNMWHFVLGLSRKKMNKVFRCETPTMELLVSSNIAPSTKSVTFSCLYVWSFLFRTFFFSLLIFTLHKNE